MNCSGNGNGHLARLPQANTYANDFIRYINLPPHLLSFSLFFYQSAARGVSSNIALICYSGVFANIAFIPLQGNAAVVIQRTALGFAIKAHCTFLLQFTVAYTALFNSLHCCTALYCCGVCPNIALIPLQGNAAVYKELLWAFPYKFDCTLALHCTFQLTAL